MPKQLPYQFQKEPMPEDAKGPAHKAQVNTDNVRVGFIRVCVCVCVCLFSCVWGVFKWQWVKMGIHFGTQVNGTKD